MATDLEAAAETRAAWNYMLRSTRRNRQKYANLQDKALIQSLQERLREAHRAIASLQSQVAEIHSSGRDPQVKSLDSLTKPVGRARPASCLELTRIPNLESDEVALDDCDKCSDARASSESDGHAASAGVE